MDGWIDRFFCNAVGVFVAFYLFISIDVIYDVGDID